MKERPILFSGEMVRAILSGPKTQTRRVVKPQPIGYTGRTYIVPDEAPKKWHDASNVLEFCPYGAPGDLLWVREQFSRLEAFDFFSRDVPKEVPGCWYWADGNPNWGDWERPRPSIHMPRDLSRITLRVTDVRVQRLQEISEDDARAEGIERINVRTSPLYRDYSGNDSHAVDMTHSDPRDSFRSLWDSINAKRGYPWESNPFVWAITFERVEAERRAV